MFKRIYLAFFGLTIIFGLLISNLGIIIFNTSNSPVAQTANTKSIVLGSSRGMIYDCNMQKIVNSDTAKLTVCLPSTDALNTISEHITDDERQSIYEKMSKGEVCILSLPKRFNDAQVKTAIVSNRYTQNQPCVHLIGHLDENRDGTMGLEKSYNSYLKKHSGTLKATWSVDALGNILWGDGIEFKNEGYLSPAGIQLTIDLQIQQIAEDVLENQNISEGAIVILNSETNEILALASAPTFNPLDLSSSMNNENSPFLNRALTPYSVGSVFKPFVACCGLENGTEISHNCTGSIDIGGTIFKCNNNNAHGVVNMVSAMEQSCNTFFIALGQKTGSEDLISICEDFGLGKAIELADNLVLRSGKLPTADNLNSPQALANLSFGQGELLASPLQMAVAYSCFANGGYYREPTLMKGIVDSNGNIIQKVKLPQKYRILNESTAEKIDNALESVVKNGSGNKAYSENTHNHGKTATAQSGWYENGKEINHTWFCGYFTANGTTYTAVIFKESGKSGAIDCAPSFKEISDRIFAKTIY